MKLVEDFVFMDHQDDVDKSTVGRLEDLGIIQLRQATDRVRVTQNVFTALRMVALFDPLPPFKDVWVNHFELTDSSSHCYVVNGPHLFRNSSGALFTQEDIIARMVDVLHTKLHNQPSFQAENLVLDSVPTKR